MTISVWRYSHLVLAVSSFIFIALASITGVILSFEAVNDKMPAYEVKGFDTLRLSQVIPVMKESFSEITELSVDERNFVTLKGFDADGEKVHAHIDPATGKILGMPREQSDFFKWTTALHRSLFLHELGRFFIGLTSFLLLLITVSGAILVVQRQHGLRRFFNKIAKDYFAQYYHVLLGRFMLVPIFIIALSGTYLSLVRFEVFAEKKISHKITVDEEADELPEKQALAGFDIFKNSLLSQVRSIEFPFADDDPEEYYTLKLKDREFVVNQFNGTVLSEVQYPFTKVLTGVSLNLHTGRSSIVWAIVLGIASVNILFFIYSGFVITIRRRRSRIKNKYNASEARYVLLAGSENGSTLHFAGAIHKQLLDNKEISFLGELNQYTQFPKAEHIVVFTSTYGLGDAPSNAGKLSRLVDEVKQAQLMKVSVVGFGSNAYPDFCGYAREVNELLTAQDWAEPVLDLHTVDDKSPEHFVSWVKNWNLQTGLSLATTPALYNQVPADLQKMMVLEKTLIHEAEQTFMLTLRIPGRTKFRSGDLLAVYPANDNRERLYSIGKVDNNIQLLVKYHEHGLGSEYLYALQPGAVIKARVIVNATFHFPQKSPVVVMISNGTGIAPFLGMVAQNKKRAEARLYCGFRHQTEMTHQYNSFINKQVEQQHLEAVHFAYSRQDNYCYVMDLIKRDAEQFARWLSIGATIMLCGSLAMQRDVEAVIDAIGIARNSKGIDYYKSAGQILADCY